MKKYCFGIDVGGTTVKCGLFDVEGKVLDKWEIPTRTEEEGAHILTDVAEAIEKKTQEKSLNKEEIAGVGIGVPGPVDENGDVLMAVNLHWGHKCIEKELAELTGLPVRAGNDANVAALGEMWMGRRSRVPQCGFSHSGNWCWRRYHHQRKDHQRNPRCRR